MMSFQGQASWAKMMSPRGKLTALECHPTKKVKRSKELKGCLHETAKIGPIFAVQLILPGCPSNFCKHPTD
jgi:hypothetical protein